MVGCSAAPLMLLAPWALAPFLLTSAPVHARYDASARAELRPRSILPGDAATTRLSTDVEVTSQLRAQATAGRYGLSVLYGPRMLIREVQLDGQPQILHCVGLELGRTFQPYSRLFVSQSLSRGVTQFNLLSSPGVPGVSGPGSSPPTTGAPAVSTRPIPIVRRIEYLESESLVGLDLRLDRRRLLSTRAGWYVSGGFGSVAEATLPLQAGPVLNSSLAFAASRSDALVTTLNANHASFSSGERATLVAASETWRHAYDHTGTLAVSLGASGSRLEQPLQAGPTAGFFPTAGVEWSQRVPLKGHRIEGTLGTSLQPTIDRFTGQVVQRLEGRFSSSWMAGQEWRFQARGSASNVVSSGPQQGDKIALLELGAGVPFSRNFGTEVGVRSAWQSSQVFTLQNAYQWLAYVSLSAGSQGPL